MGGGPRTKRWIQPRQRRRHAALDRTPEGIRDDGDLVRRVAHHIHHLASLRRVGRSPVRDREVSDPADVAAVAPELGVECFQKARPFIARRVDLGMQRQEYAETCDLELYDAYTADEVFLSSTAGGMLPVSVIDGRRIGIGRPGPVFRAVDAAYRALVSSEKYATAVPA